MARSGVIPREYPGQCRFREFSQTAICNSLTPKGTISSACGRPSVLAKLDMSGRTSVGEAIHGKNSLWQHVRDGSAGSFRSAQLIVVGTRSPWRSGRNDRLNGNGKGTDTKGWLGR